MSTLKFKIMQFIKNGFRVFAKSSKGKYNVRSPKVDEFRKELLVLKRSNAIDDRINLKKDQIEISKDVRKSISKLVLE